MPLDWLPQRAHIGLFAIMIMSIWKYAGYFMLILLAALKLVPSDPMRRRVSAYKQLDAADPYHRAADLADTYFVLIIAVLHSYQIFDYVYVMTQGGPADSTNVLTY